MRRDLFVNPAMLCLASLALMAGLLQFYWPAANGLDVTGHPIGRDFINVWAGPQVAFRDGVSALFDLRGYYRAIGELFGQPLPFHNWSYPLFVLPIFWPLSQLPYFWALAVWTLGFFALFAAIVLAEIDRAKRPQALLLLALAPACLINTVGGQNGFLSAALLLGGALNIERRPVVAGMLFGLLTYKPHLGLVLPFALIALGAWRVIASAVVTTIALFAMSISIFGLDAWREYLTAVGGFQTELLRVYRGFYVLMMVSPLAGARTAGLGFPIAVAIQAVVSVAVVTATCLAIRRICDPCQRASLLAIAALLATPYAFNYDMPAVAAVIVWALAGRLQWPSNWQALLFLAWLAPTAMMFLNLSGIAVTPLILIALFVLSTRDALRPLAMAWGAAPILKSLTAQRTVGVADRQ